MVTFLRNHVVLGYKYIILIIAVIYYLTACKQVGYDTTGTDLLIFSLLIHLSITSRHMVKEITNSSYLKLMVILTFISSLIYHYLYLSDLLCFCDDVTSELIYIVVEYMMVIGIMVSTAGIHTRSN